MEEPRHLNASNKKRRHSVRYSSELSSSVNERKARKVNTIPPRSLSTMISTEAYAPSRLPPRKREPMGKKWESRTKKWVITAKLPRMALKPRPAGRAPDGMTWDDFVGTWVIDEFGREENRRESLEEEIVRQSQSPEEGGSFQSSSETGRQNHGQVKRSSKAFTGLVNAGDSTPKKGVTPPSPPPPPGRPSSSSKVESPKNDEVHDGAGCLEKLGQEKVQKVNASAISFELEPDKQRKANPSVCILAPGLLEATNDRAPSRRKLPKRTSKKDKVEVNDAKLEKEQLREPEHKDLRTSERGNGRNEKKGAQDGPSSKEKQADINTRANVRQVTMSKVKGINGGKQRAREQTKSKDREVEEGLEAKSKQAPKSTGSRKDPQQAVPQCTFPGCSDAACSAPAVFCGSHGGTRQGIFPFPWLLN